MIYQVKSPILGFEDIQEVRFTRIDELLAKIEVVDNEAITFSLINPYALREYSFELPAHIQALMEIGEGSTVNVYNILAVQNPSDASIVNFLAPFIFNDTNGTCAQLTLAASQYPQFGLAEEIGQYTQEAMEAQA